MVTDEEKKKKKGFLAPEVINRNQAGSGRAKVLSDKEREKQVEDKRIADMRGRAGLEGGSIREVGKVERFGEDVSISEVEARNQMTEQNKQMGIGRTAQQFKDIQDITAQAQNQGGQVQQVAPEQTDLRLDQDVAKLGLAIPVFAANKITAVLEGVTGKKFGRTTTEDLATTAAGEALGLGIVGAGLAAGGFYAYESYLAGLSAQQLVNLAGTKALPTSFRLPAVTSLTRLSTAKVLIGGGAVQITRTVRKDAKNAIIGNKDLIDDVLEDVAIRGKSYSQAVKELNDIEANINLLESKMKFWGRLDLTYWLSGGKDDLTDLKNTRDYLGDARADLAGVAQQAVMTR